MLSNNNNNSVDAWKAVERWLHKVDRSSPINLKFITSPLNETITNRIRSLEAIYQRSKMYRFLVQKGVNPFFLFSSVTAGLSFGMFRAYTRSTRLSLTLLGVVYPTLECWKIIQDTNEDQQQLKELKGWLTYWLIFGSFRVLDHWIVSDLAMVSKKKYQLYQLFILYWAQNPHSNGASILYRHVIQKPHEEEEEEEEEEKIKEEQIVVQQEEQEQQHQVQQSLVLKLRQEQEEEIIKPYSFLDGYTPPNLLSQALSNSSDDDDSVRSNQLNIPSPQQQQKEAFPMIMNTAEAVW